MIQKRFSEWEDGIVEIPATKQKKEKKFFKEDSLRDL